MKNKLVDLNKHLFAQLERLGDENLKGEEFAAELNRSKDEVSYIEIIDRGIKCL